MVGAFEDLARRTQLDDLTGVHDREVVAGGGQDRQVVGDEDHREIQVPYPIGEHVQNLLLNHHVQGGRGLIGHD